MCWQLSGLANSHLWGAPMPCQLPSGASPISIGGWEWAELPCDTKPNGTNGGDVAFSKLCCLLHVDSTRYEESAVSLSTLIKLVTLCFAGKNKTNFLLPPQKDPIVRLYDCTMTVFCFCLFCKWV